MGFAENLGSCSSMKAEIRAVLRGLKIAPVRGVTHLWIQLDSKVLADMLQGHMAWCRYHRILLLQCRDLIYWDRWNVRISHCFRDANQTADGLANLGVTMNLGVTIFQIPPLEVRDVLYADCVGG